MKKRNLLAVIGLLCLLLTVAVSAAEIPQTLPPHVRAVQAIDAVPDSWSPLGERTETAERILSLTADRLYVLSSDAGELIPSLAAALPEDVTAEYAGTYGVPALAQRGYAFRIALEEKACWEDGELITADDWLFLLEKLIDREALGLELANLDAYYRNEQKVTKEVVSLMDAGFSSVKEASAEGYTQFYVDTTYFWGLNTGWVSATDRTALLDEAIPSGITERYVSGAYLYRRYLSDGGLQSVFQSEFVGIPAKPEYYGKSDIGMLRVGEDAFVLILAAPTTRTALALELGELILLRESLFGDAYATSAATYSACGPYRVTEVTDEGILLEPNPYWHGKTDAPDADSIYLSVS